MSQEPTELEREAIARMNLNDFDGAARYWERLLKDQPDWEHGAAAYGLANCYEEMKRLEDAGHM